MVLNQCTFLHTDRNTPVMCGVFFGTKSVYISTQYSYIYRDSTGRVESCLFLYCVEYHKEVPLVQRAVIAGTFMGSTLWVIFI